MALASLFTLAAPAQELDLTATAARADLHAALAELAVAQREIAEEKIPLAQKLNSLEEQLLAKRRELDRLQRRRDNELVDLNVLKSELKSRNDEHHYINGLLAEYVSLFETQIHISEVQRYRAEISDAHHAATHPDFSPADKLEKQISHLQTSLARIRQLIAGDVFDGRALTSRGVVEQGTFAAAGPVVVFASSQSDATGIVDLQLGSAEPTISAIAPEFASGIRAIVAGKSGELPVDVSLGNALKIASTKAGFVAHVRKGGPVMVPILALGVTALIIGMIKWSQIAGIRVASPRDLQHILFHIRKGDREKAIGHAGSIKGPVGAMLVTAIRHAHEEKEYIEEVLYEKMLNTKPALERLLPVIALTAATAPLLGLLGTVTGMINTFNMITVFGTGDPKTLASGISEALITTEFGLIVAVPALLIHSFVSRKAKGVLGSMEQTAVGFINGLPTSKTESEYAGTLD